MMFTKPKPSRRVLYAKGALQMSSTTNGNAVRAAEDDVLEAARRLVEGNVLSLSQHGNISVKVPGADQFVLTGGGTLNNLSRDDLAVLDLDGNIVSGNIGPASAEIIQMHAAVYRKRADVGSVIHTHSPHVTAYALASKPIEPVYEALVRFGITEPVPVAAYGPRGSERSVSNIIDVIGPNTKVVLLANHGLLAFHKDMASTVHIIFVLEETAGISLSADLIGGAKPIPAELLGETTQRRVDFERAGTITASGEAEGEGEGAA